MKTVKSGLRFALVLALVVGFYLPVQADIFDAGWYKARIQGVTRLFVLDEDGEVEKVKLKGTFYFKLCSVDFINACGGEEYFTAVAVADFNDDGEFGDNLLEVFVFLGGDPNGLGGAFIFDTCDGDETGFRSFLFVGDIDEDVGVNLLLDAETVGRVKEEGEKVRANAGNGGTSASVFDLDGVFGFDSGNFRKLSWKADKVDVEDLPETLFENLFDLGLIADPDDPVELLCDSEIVVPEL